jgi:L-lactate dehydrogenase complex protein LldE
MSPFAKTQSVQLFGTCLIETLYPQAGMAVVRVLERLGLTVEYPDGQTCCGQPAFNGGAWDDARAMARHTLDVLAGKGVLSNAPTDPNAAADGNAPTGLNTPTAPAIVVPSGSCADMIVHHYPELLANDPKYGPLADSVAARTYEFSQFLTDVLGITNLKAHTHGRLTYHSSCHLLRGLGVKDGPRQLLANVDGAEIVELPGAAECCGFGGLFAVKMSDISGAMLKRKLDNVENTKAEAIVGCDVSCLLHIGGGLHRRGSNVQTRHLAEILAEVE